MFKYPTNSKDLYMWKLFKDPENNCCYYNVKEIAVTMVKLSLNLEENAREKVYVIPLLHC